MAKLADIVKDLPPIAWVVGGVTVLALYPTIKATIAVSNFAENTVAPGAKKIANDSVFPIVRDVLNPIDAYNRYLMHKEMERQEAEARQKIINFNSRKQHAPSQPTGMQE